MALGFGAAVTAGCGVAAADSSPASSASTSSSAQSSQSVGAHRASATTARSARQPKSLAVNRRSALPAPARTSAKATTTKNASALGNPLAFLNSIARQVQVTFFNRTPTVTYDASKDVVNDDGTITGQVIGKDADGDTLKYSASNPVNGGTVVIDSQGQFTFTPGPDFVASTGDLFTATVSDAAPGQFHGLMGLLVPGWGSTAKVAAKVFGTPIPPGDSGGAGTWGTPTRSTYFTGESALTGWWVYNGKTQHGNRTPNQISFADGIMTITGDADGNDAGIAWGPGQTYGAWEVRVRVPAGAPNYDPVLLLWPDAENWPTGGEIDFMEIWGDGARQAVNSVLHYGATNQQAGATMAVDATQWHTYAVSWTPTRITTYVDGTPIFTTTDTSTFPPGPMHLAIQLDMLGPDISAGAQMQVAWVKEYALGSFT